MKEFGYKRVEIWLDKAEKQVIDDYCHKHGLAVATFIRRNAFDVASGKGGGHGS